MRFRDYIVGGTILFIVSLLAAPTSIWKAIVIGMLVGGVYPFAFYRGYAAYREDRITKEMEKFCQ